MLMGAERIKRCKEGNCPEFSHGNGHRVFILTKLGEVSEIKLTFC